MSTTTTRQQTTVERHTGASQPALAHTDIQTATYFAARATIQTAIVLASGMGSNAKRDQRTVRLLAVQLLLAALPVESGMDIFEIDMEKHKRSKKDADEKEAAQVQLVVAALDGANALLRGDSGSVSAVAAGPPGSFKNPSKDTRSYVVVAVGERMISEGMKSVFTQYEKRTLPTKASLTDYFGDNSRKKGEADKTKREKYRVRLLDDLINAACLSPVVATMLDSDNYKSWSPVIIPWHCTRNLYGSSVAAALAAFRGKVGFAIFIARLPQVIQASVAARCLNGRLFAIPIIEPNKAKFSSAEVKIGKGTILKETDFVSGDNNCVSLCCTSISEICVLDRVRFESELAATTETITLSLIPRMMTLQNDTLRRTDKALLSADESDATLKDLIEACT